MGHPQMSNSGHIQSWAFKICTGVKAAQYQCDKNNIPFYPTPKISSIFAPAYLRKGMYLIA
jgi:hypothetical protein